MKPIWLINHYAIPPNRRGGTRHHGLAQYLIQQGFDPVIIASDYSHFQQQYLADALASTETLDVQQGVSFAWVHTKPAYQGNGIKRLLNMFSFVQQLLCKKALPTKKPVAILASSPHLFAALGGYLLARRYNVPFILEVRDIWPETLTADGKISRKHPLILIMAAIEKFLYRRADKIIAVMAGFPQYVKEKMGADIAAKCDVLPNFVVNTPEFPLLMEKDPALPFVVMYAGSHGYANGLDIVLQAAGVLNAKQLPIEIHLIGSGPEKAALIQQAEAAQLTNVKFFEAVPKTAMMQTLATADAYLMPLRDNPVFQWGISPNKLFDYFAMAKPVIAAVNTTLNPVQLADAGIALPGLQAETFAQAIIDVYHASFEQRQQWGQNAWNYLQQHHTLAAVGEKLVANFNAILKSNSAKDIV